MGQFGINQSVTRREDRRLLSGQGCFTDDLIRPGIAHGYVLRSSIAHGRITRLDCATARHAPGVLAIYTAAELAEDSIQPIACRINPSPKPGTEFKPHPQPLLASDRVRFVGEGIAFIVAESEAQARDAAELIEFEIEPLLATIRSKETAVKAAAIWDDAPNNISFDWELGDQAAVEAAFAVADKIITLAADNNRIVISSLETRGAMAEFDPRQDRYLLRTGTQMPHGIKRQLHQVLGVPLEQLQVLVAEVGGSFGGKNSLCPEQALVLYAAGKLGHPVKWIASREEAFLSDFHGRDNSTQGELAVDVDGQFLALRVTNHANLGAYTASGGPLSPINVHMACNCYRIPAVYINVKGVYSNTAPTDVYRGAGRPEILYLVERLIDVAAFDLAMDRIELRRRNVIPPNAFPYSTPTGLNYDQCYFEKVMDEALSTTDWHDFEARRHESERHGRLRGIGLANYVERCGGGVAQSESATLQFDPSGSATLLIGSMSNGQGHETTYSQIINQRLGLPFAKIQVVQGDTDRIATGTGTGGSWSMSIGGTAVWRAIDSVIEKAKLIAGQLLEAASSDLDFADGTFHIVGTDRRITFEKVVQAAFDPANLPQGSELGLQGDASFRPENFTFPYGCHVCEVEVDPETGAVDVLDYTAVHDFGQAINPLLLAGQVHGGVTQGIGQALTEHTVYDEDGQLLSGSFMDYCLPRAADLPEFKFIHRTTASPANPLGVKGCGEAGAAGPPPALINAVVNALNGYSIRHIDMPTTPFHIWQILQANQAGTSACRKLK